MKNSIHYSPEAQNDLDEIWEYVSFELCNPQAAENTVNKIMDTVDELESFSEIGVPLYSVTDMESFCAVSANGTRDCNALMITQVSTKTLISYSTFLPATLPESYHLKEHQIMT